MLISLGFNRKLNERLFTYIQYIKLDIAQIYKLKRIEMDPIIKRKKVKFALISFDKDKIKVTNF